MPSTPGCLLVAEDEILVAMEMEDSLEASGHRVCGVAMTAPQAIDLAERHMPDLALVDVNLADGTNGLDAVKAIKERYAIPAIIVSGHANAQDAERAGAIGWIAKPFRFDDVLNLVNYILEARKGTTPAGPKPRGLIANGLGG